ncbi:MAG: peptide-methionine (S)-S-oxide reductase MsrA [Candidatus Dormibacteria bacterium]
MVPRAERAGVATRETAVFAGGCFWGVEDAFRHLPGVVDTRVGYTGGHTEHPTYREVCSHTTGHAEAVEVVYDPALTSYEDLVTAFLFDIHDPTQLNRQGPDVGDQYRSAVYVRDAGQRATAERVLGRLAEQNRSRRPIVTEITDAPRFWEAEEYHQQYFEKQGGGACHLPVRGSWMRG